MEILTYQARKAKDMSLQNLADATGISKSTLHNIETGKVSPTLAQLDLIAVALETKITALFMSKNK